MIRHLFQRTITYKGKKIKAWYYWYTDENTGRQIKKTCGQNRIPCTVKREAQAFIAELATTDKDIKEHYSPTLKEATKDIFNPNSPHLNRLAQRGKVYRENSIRSKQNALKKILSAFGDRQVHSIKEREVEQFLLDLDCANATKNLYLSVLNEIYDELKFRGLVEKIIKVKSFHVKNYSTKGILSKDEIQTLFPDDYDCMVALWTNILKVTSLIKPDRMAVLCFVTLSAGLRLGEVLALQYNQFIKEDTILLNAMMSGDKRVDYLKKGTDDNKKWRVVIIPDKAVKMIEKLKQKYPHEKDNFLFLDIPKNNPCVYNLYFKKMCRFIGIDTTARNISFHSLRFTNDTYSKREMNVSDLQLMLGHSSPLMTEYYDRSTALDKLPIVEKNRETINSLWN